MEKLRHKWTFQQNIIDEFNIEKIALNNVRKASMVKGIEALFEDINDYIELFKKGEFDKEQNQENKKFHNPYREDK